ncbi:MAG: LysM peptidoglycan-binding domain-containing protein [Anaerolineales bacterium]|nr:LysM peptidoglycan-binding domain-containing protein [Anaerolineales bacterium]
MNSKSIARFGIFVVLALLATLIPFRVRAGGVCGGAYTIEKGDTLAKLAALCGTTTQAILAANPNLKEPLTVGQTITIPGASLDATPTPSAGNATAIPGSVTPIATASTYIIQVGDSFISIAGRHKISVADLRAANPQITNIDTIYVGQTLFIPVVAGSSTAIPSTPTAATKIPATKETPHPLFYNSELPKNAAFTDVELINKSGSEVYISFRTTRSDGTHAINEFPVKTRIKVRIPVGWIDYTAWVGGKKYDGSFVLRDGVPFSVTFQRGKIVAE